MFQLIKSRLADMKTIEILCRQAEKHALDDQQNTPGAEHFLLSAFDLPDGTARQVFDSLGADPAAIKPAIRKQYTDAIRALGLYPDGILADAIEDDAIAEKRHIYDAAASGQEVMQTLAANRQKHAPLLGAHVLSAVASMQHGVAARTLRTIGVDLDLLKSTADLIAEGNLPRAADNPA